jgi:hypothetical protein
MSLESQFSELKEFAAKEKLEIVLSASASRRGGRKGGVGGIPPAEPSQFRSDILKQTPPVRKCVHWLARYAGSPAVLCRKFKPF